MITADGAPEWVDWVGALGGFGGFALALVALIFAIKSAGQAERSAKAAEDTAASADRTAKASEEALALEREEHRLLLRRPKLLPVLEIEQDRLDEGVVVVVFGALNVGEKVAHDTILMFSMAEVVGIEATDHGGPLDVQPQRIKLYANGVEHPARSFNDHRDIVPGVRALTHVALHFPAPGSYEGDLRIAHAEVEDQLVKLPFWIDVPDDPVGASSLRARGERV